MKNSETPSKVTAPPTTGLAQYSPSDRERMANLYKNGKLQSEIAQEFGCSARTIGRILHQLGVSMRPKGPSGWYSTQERKYMVEMFCGGQTQDAIAQQFGCCTATIGKILRKCGISIWSRVHRRPYSARDRERMAEMYRAGKTCKEIAQKYGCSPHSVANILRRLGVPIRYGGTQSRYSAQDRERMAEMYREGLTHQSIAQEFGCGRAAIGKILCRLGVSKQPDRGLNQGSIQDREGMVAASQPPPDESSRIALDDLIREFWQRDGRAVGVMLSSPDERSQTIKAVEDALRYGYNRLYSKMNLDSDQSSTQFIETGTMPKKAAKKAVKKAVKTSTKKAVKKTTGAGRPMGSGKYGCETKAVRVPAHLVDDVQAFAMKKIKAEGKK